MDKESKKVTDNEEIQASDEMQNNPPLTTADQLPEIGGQNTSGLADEANTLTETDSSVGAKDTEGDEESTIFAQSNYDEEGKRGVNTKRRGTNLIIMVLVLVIIAGSAFGIYKFLPNVNNPTSSEQSSAITVKSISSSNLSKLVIKNLYGTFNLVSQVTNPASSASGSSSQPTVKWSLPGYDSTLIADSSISSIADKATTLYALRKMEDASADYGLDKPSITIAATGQNQVNDYTITIGNQSPDSSGSYVSVSGVDGVFLVSSSVISSFNFNAEKLADTVIVKTPEKSDGVDSKYFDEEGKLSTFDSISLSGSYYKNPVTIQTITNQMAPYELTSPIKRYADKDATEALFGLLTNGLVAADTYKLMPSAADIKSYGFDKPDAVVAFKLGSKVITIKAVKRSDEQDYYAVMVDGRAGIYKVSAEALTMLNARESDYYNDFVFLETISDFSNIYIDTTAKDYSYDISYDEKTEEITVKQNGKTLKSEIMQAYFPYFTTLKPQLQESYVSGPAEMTVTFTYRDTSKGKSVMTFVKQTERRYLVTINGQKTGLISSAVFNSLVNYADYVETGKEVPAI